MLHECNRLTLACSFCVLLFFGVALQYERETEKVDVFSLGNVLYFLVTEGMDPWDIEDIKTKEVYKRVMDGKRAQFPDKVLESTHPYEKYVLEAIKLCWIHDPKERASAQQVADKLAEGLKVLSNYSP